MAHVVPVRDDMRDTIYEEVIPSLKPPISQAAFYRQFAASWADDRPKGYVLINKSDRIVGYLGLLQSAPVIGGTAHGLCNISTWVVREEERGSALSLVWAALQKDNLTFTCLTPAAVSTKIFSKLRFSQLEASYCVLPSPLSVTGFLSRSEPGKSAEIISEAGEVEAALDEDNRRILRDHAPYPCQHLLLRANGKQSCYILLNRIDRYVPPELFRSRALHERLFSKLHYKLKRNFGVSQILYLSDPLLFATYSKQVARFLLETAGSLHVVADSRLFHGCRPADSVILPLPVVRLFRSTTLPAEKIANYYSELAVVTL